MGKSSKRAGVSLETLQNTRQSGRDKVNGVAGRDASTLATRAVHQNGCVVVKIFNP